ncbi:MAG TPA: PepSY-associated TM helix domain-containing protein, partial [Pyrinomonadaceae bacterium]|nr:PepSY-associated TM helix domain-containing protein [Pyrinomonadaceae bacterium]
MRKILIKLHMYLGLCVGLLLAMIGLTGSIIVFGDEIDRLLNPRLLRVEVNSERATAQGMLDAVRVAYPNEKPARMRLPRDHQDSAEICFGARRDPRCVYVDPYRTAILGERVPAHSFKNRVVSLHRRLLSGETGETIIGICGLLLLTLSASGLVLWWPGRKSASRRLKVKRGGGSYRTNFDLHRIVGI